MVQPCEEMLVNGKIKRDRMDIQGWIFLLLDVFWTSACGYGDLYAFPGEHVCIHVSACKWAYMGRNVYVSCHGVCPSWEHLWNLATLDGHVQSLLSGLGLRWPLHVPSTSLPVLWRRAGVSPNIPVFLEVPITEALCTDSQGRL